MYKTKVNVLLIDDDTIYQYIACKTLEATGYVNKIHICSNGEEGYSYIKKNMHIPANMPDVILLDVNMPIMNGWEFLDAYQAIQPNISKDVQIFLVTSSINNEDKQASRRYTAVHNYIVKPLVKEKIAEVLAAVAVVQF